MLWVYARQHIVNDTSYFYNGDHYAGLNSLIREAKDIVWVEYNTARLGTALRACYKIQG